MSQRVLLTGPDFGTLEGAAFERLADEVGTQPESVLYVVQREHPREETQRRWRPYGPPAALCLQTLVGLVTDCYKQDEYKGRVTHIDQQLLTRIVELGIEKLDNPSNPLHPGDRLPSAGLVEEAQHLFTELEFARLLSPAEMRERLEAEGAADRAPHVEELAASIERVRTELLANDVRETYSSERFHHVTTSSMPLAEAYPSVDAVVLSGFTQFDVLERELLERIVESWPTVAVLPTQRDTASPLDGVSGVDIGAATALETYQAMGFEREWHAGSATEEIETRRLIARNLFCHPEQSPSISSVDTTAVGLTFGEPGTIPDEIRSVARQIRHQLSTGTPPSDIGVVIPDPSRYTKQVEEVFEAYDLPFSVRTEAPLIETALGNAVEALCNLAEPPRSVDSILKLLTNPLVTITDSESETPLDHREISRVAARTETNRLATTLEHVPETTAEVVMGLVDEAAALAETSLKMLPKELEALLDRLGVNATLEHKEAGKGALSASQYSRERAALIRLDELLESLALTAPVVSQPSATEDGTTMAAGDTVGRLERALSGVTLQRPGLQTDAGVGVAQLGGVIPYEFEHVYLLGLTSTHVPSTPERTAFTEPIYEAHPDLEQVDISAEMRYYLGTILGSEASLHCSVPQRSMTGEPYVEAELVTELRRFVDLSELSDEHEHASAETPPGYQEDVHWTLGKVVAETSVDRAQEALDEGITVGTFDTAQRSRIEQGLACGEARSSPELTAYDGTLSAEMVARLHSETERVPYSPSRLETYAACGFKYYMRRVLGIDVPDRLTREPGAGDRGSYLHDVLEHYYLSLQTSDGEPVHPGGDFETRQQQLLDVALDRLDHAFDDHAQTAFQEEWLTTVLAGLGTPDTNPYYGPHEMRDGRPIGRGLFYRFLKHEAEEPAKATARPTWFEGRIGNPYDAGTPLGDEPAEIETPQGPVPLHGLIDRVETVPGTDPTQVVVRDYKTGRSIPSENDALNGLKFQLQLYALMAEEALDDVEVVGGAYYQVSPPSSVNSRSGLLTSQEMAVYHGSDEVSTPLLRHSYLHFETHEGFRRFIEQTTSQRLGDLTSGIAEGRFHPTVLDPSDAGCRYCDYAHVCDVRSHQRKDVIEGIDDMGMSAYIPLKARDYDLKDVVEVE